jgi:hypothetical protein
MRGTSVIAAVLSLATASVLVCASANATTYDLNSSWSDSSNPNGPWAILQGASLLPSQNWVAITVPQPAWAVGAGAVPAWFKAQATGTADCGGCDWNIGDVVAHTTTGGGDLVNVQFTTPTAGVADISGLVWNARNIGRAQGWDLYVGTGLATSGSLPGDGSITEGNATTFNLPGILLSAGETVDLTLFAVNGGTGDFIGNDLTINLTATPLPSTWLMLLSGFLGLGFLAYRGTKMNAAGIAAAC